MSRQSPYYNDPTFPGRHETIVKSDTGINPNPVVLESITNVVGVGGVTGSNKCYAPEKLQKVTKKIKLSEDPKEKG